MEENFKDKWKKRIADMSFTELSGFYITCNKRLVEPKYKDKQEEINFQILEIKKNWSSQGKFPNKKRKGRVKEGLMSIMGYHVGEMRGINDDHRINIIKDVLMGPLPLVGDPEYMKWWGPDKSELRLTRMKMWLNDKIYSPMNKSNYRAIGEWKEDLRWVEIYGKDYID